MGSWSTIARPADNAKPCCLHIYRTNYLNCIVVSRTGDGNVRSAVSYISLKIKERSDRAWAVFNVDQPP